jgi:hypothetical protein
MFERTSSSAHSQRGLSIEYLRTSAKSADETATAWIFLLIGGGWVARIRACLLAYHKGILLMIAQFSRRLLLAALLGGALSTSVHAATIQTDGSNNVTGVLGLQVPGKGTFNVDFVFGSINDLYGSPTSPVPTPMFYNDEPGAIAANNAMVAEFNNVGGLLGLKDDVGGAMTIDASIPHTPMSSGAIVDTLFSNSGTWGRFAQTFFGENIDFMQAVFSPVPEPGAAGLLGLGVLGLAVRRWRKV